MHDREQVLLLRVGRSSQSAQTDGAITIGVRSWILPISSVASVVMIVPDQYQASSWSSGTSGFFHSSYRPAKARMSPSVR